MKTFFASIIMVISISLNAQTDTLMMNNRFSQDPSIQKYQLSSLMNYTSACNTSFITGIIGTGCFVAAALIPNIEPQSKLLFMASGTILLSVSIGYHISSINIIDNPTNIVPVKK